MKKAIKVLVVIIIFLLFSITISYGFGIDDLKGNQKEISNVGLTDTGNYIVSVITTIAIVVSVIVLAVLGLKYMLGSVEERAEYKKTLMPYFIGAMITFGASTIANIIYLFVKE